MTKPQRLKNREGEFIVDRAIGRIQHQATGVAYLAEPSPISDARAAALEAQGYSAFGQCHMPPGVIDRRAPHQIAPESPNEAGVMRWSILARTKALQALADDWIPRHGQQQAAQMLAAQARRAGEAWVYAARLDRERPQ